MEAHRKKNRKEKSAAPTMQEYLSKKQKRQEEPLGEEPKPTVAPLAEPKPEPQPSKPQRQRRGRRRIVVVFVLATVLVVVLGAVVAGTTFFILPADSDGIERDFIIVPGTSLLKIADALQDDGLVRSGPVFALLLRFQGRTPLVKAGTFILSPAMSPRRISDILTAQAPPEPDITVLIPEGFSVFEVVARLQGEGVVDDADALLRATVKVPFFDFLPPCEESRGEAECSVVFEELEGFLFPDTYRFWRNSSPSDVALRFLENFDAKVSSGFREEAAVSGKSLFDITTVASLVEEEAKLDQDRARIAGILYKRLELGMALQVDATVLYAKERKQGGELTNREVTYEDLEIDSLYNAYKYPGLPPGPIASPGMKSLFAALRPKASTYLYYLHTPDGTTIFSRTLGEHNIAKARYLR